MRLLLAVDSITSLEILLPALRMRSWPDETEVRVLSVVEDGEVAFATWRAEGYGVSGVRQEMRNRGAEITPVALSRLREIGLPAEVTVMRGNPEFLIPFVAREWAADLILIRAHNRTDFRNWMLGSVAKSVIESASCSVQVVRAHAEASPVTRSMRILLAADDSEVSLGATRAVAETIWPAETEVKVVSVVNPLTYSLEEMGLFNDQHTKRAHRAIVEALNLLKGGPAKISGEVIAGRIARSIIARAENWNADLIVLGTNERRGLRRLLRGSVAAAIANRAHCSVRVIRDGNAVRTAKSLPRSSHSSAQRFGVVYRFEDELGWKRAG